MEVVQPDAQEYLAERRQCSLLSVIDISEVIGCVMRWLVVSNKIKSHRRSSARAFVHRLTYQHTKCVLEALALCCFGVVGQRRLCISCRRIVRLQNSMW